MADNVQVTAGSGTTLATIENTSVHYPIYIPATELNDTIQVHNSLNPFPVTIPGSNDAFGRLRVSDPYTLFDSKFLYDKASLFWAESTTGSASATHSTTNAAVTMEVNGGTDTVIRQTKMRFNYQPAKSQLVFMTGTLGTAVSDTTRRIGLFDNTNGLYFKLDDSTLSVNIMKNTAETEITQDNWNIDKMDGTGVSGITIDTQYNQIFVIDFEWLGVGAIRFGFVIDGTLYYVHKQSFSNTTGTGAYMSSPNLPIRYDIVSTGGSGSMLQVCSSVISEGGQQDNGVLRAGGNGVTLVTGLNSGNSYAIYGIRQKTTHLDSVIRPNNIDFLSSTGDDLRWTLRINPTVAGTFTYSDITNSCLQSAVGTSSNTVGSTGTVVAEGYIIGNGTVNRSLESALRIGSDIAGTRDTLVVCISPFTNGAQVATALSWRELV